MKTERKCLFTKPAEDREATIKKGLLWLHERCHERKVPVSGLIAIDHLHQLEFGSDITRAIGDDLSKCLKDSRVLAFEDGCKAKLVIKNEKELHSWRGPILAIHPSSKLLDKLDDILGVTDILVLSWTAKDVEEWIKTWNALELGQESDTPLHDKEIDIPQQVELALNNILTVINKSTGIHHPSDREFVVNKFKSLKKRKIHLDHLLIRRWLLRQQGIDSDVADQISALAQKIQDGRQVHAR